MDYQAILYNPIYSIQGVPCVLALCSEPLTGLDKTAGVDTGESVGVPTIKPAVCLRMVELAANGVAVADLPKTDVTINGFTWRVLNYRMKPSPNGENDGEVLLILTTKRAAP